MPPNEPGVYQGTWEETIDLRDLLKVILQRKWLIIGLTATAATAAAFLSFFVLPPVYESEVVLQLPTSEAANEVGYTLPALSAMAKSPAVLRSVAARLPATEPSPDLQRTYKVTLDADARLLRVNAEADTAQEAQALLSLWVEVFSESVSRSTVQAAQERLAKAEAVLEARRAELESARSELHAFNALYALDALEAQVKDLEEWVLASEAKIRTLKLHSIPSDEERLTHLKAELERQPLVWDWDESAALLVEASQALGGPIHTDSMINPTHIQLQQAIVETSVQLAANRTLLEQLTIHTAEAKPQLAQMRDELSRLRLEETSLKEQVSEAEALFESAQSEYLTWSSRATLGERVSVRIVSEPTLPVSPIKPRKVLNVAIAAFLGMFVGLGVTFLLEIWPSEIDAPGSIAPSGVQQ